MQETLAIIIALFAIVYGVVRIVKTFTGRRECLCDQCPIADCPGRDAGGAPDCTEE